MHSVLGQIKSVLAAISHNPAAAAAIGAAILAFISGVLGPLVQLIIGSRQAAAAQRAVDLTGSREIATMRLSNRQDQRSAIGHELRTALAL